MKSWKKGALIAGFIGFVYTRSYIVPVILVVIGIFLGNCYDIYISNLSLRKGGNGGFKAGVKGAVVAVALYELGAVLVYTKVISISVGSLSGLFAIVYFIPFYMLWTLGSEYGLSENASLILFNFISLVIFALIGAKIADSIEKRYQ